MTDWWGFAATLFAGIITALSTIIAVIYTNRKTKEQLVSQEQKFAEERKKQNKLAKYVIIRPSHQLITFTQLLDRLIVNNDYNRYLLFSGEDGFDFFDDPDKQISQLLRILMIQNQSPNEIHNVKLITRSELINSSTNEKMIYETTNQTRLLRSNESIVIRLTNQQQFDSIINMTQNNIGSDLRFACTIEYETLGEQRITYSYQLNIRDNKRIDVIQDGIESVIDIDNQAHPHFVQSVFRNLQDPISYLDRSEYAWRKMGQAQASGAFQILQAGMQQMNAKIAPNESDGQK